MKNFFATTAFALAIFLLNPTASAKEIEGVNLPGSVTVEGEKLSLNGAGVRSIKLAFVPIKVYVAAFYAPRKLTSPGEVMEFSGPLELTFTFLRDASQSQVDDGWNKQFDFSVTQTYDGFDADRAKFVSLFDPIGKGEPQRVVFVGDETKVYDVDTYKGSVKGREFQRAFLSTFFGSKPVTAKLRDELLGR